MKIRTSIIPCILLTSWPLFIIKHGSRKLHWPLIGVFIITIGATYKADSALIPTEITTESVSSVVIPEMRWVLLPGGSNGSCVSNTDCCANVFCYGLEYTPGNTGDLTSYTTSFFVDCINGSSPVLSNVSCSMMNASTETNGCAQFDLVQMQCSGNGGSLDVQNGVPIIIHQVCFTGGPGFSIDIQEDVVTDLTTSIDLTGGGFATEYPEFITQSASHAYVVTNGLSSGIGSFSHVYNCAPAGSIITFAPALLNQTLVISSAIFDINKNITLQGLGMNALTLSGNNSFVLFHVLPGINFTIKDIALKNATALTNGGAIFAEGHLTLQNVLLQNNFENGIPKSLTLGGASFLTINGNVNFKN